MANLLDAFTYLEFCGTGIDGEIQNGISKAIQGFESL